MTEREYQRHAYQVRSLPHKLSAARAKVRLLERQALRLGMPELITAPGATGEAGSR